MNPLNTAHRAALVLWSLSSALFAQGTANTVPLSVTDLPIPGASSPTIPSSTALSIPLLKAADFLGAVQSIDGTAAFTLAGASFTAGQFALATAPRLVRVKSSATAGRVGRFFLVTANTASQLTVDLAGSGLADLSTALGAGDLCEIVPANTIGSVFGTAANPPPFQAGLTANGADNLLLWNGASWDTYYWTGTVGTPNNIWKSSSSTDRSNVVIFPDDGIFVVRRGTAPLTIRVIGLVPSTSEQSVIAGGGGTFLANRFPADTTLGALGLQNIPGWQPGATANSADNVLVWNGNTGGWDSYYWTGTAGTPNNIWKRSGNLDRSNTPIAAGTAVYLSHAGGAFTLTQPVPYTP